MQNIVANKSICFYTFFKESKISYLHQKKKKSYKLYRGSEILLKNKFNSCANVEFCFHKKLKSGKVRNYGKALNIK